MSNRTQMLARLREELAATGADQIWTDTHLSSLLTEAVQWYSQLFPNKSAAFRDVQAGDRTFALPPGTLEVVGVECPLGRSLPRWDDHYSSDPGGGLYRQAWTVWGDALRLRNGASGDEVGSTHLAIWLLQPWDRPDPVEQWNGPADDERLLVLWAAAEAWAWLDNQDHQMGCTAGRGVQTKAYRDQLDREVSARKRRASSRTLEVIG